MFSMTIVMQLPPCSLKLTRRFNRRMMIAATALDW